jgi:hypothetical protein
MSAFEFFFGFYGLILGLAVVEIVSGFARVLRAGRISSLGLCTPLLGLFVLLDLLQFWVDTWGRHQEPHINAGVLTIALAIAAIYYLAASLVFPERLEAWDSLDDYFDGQKRTVVVASLVANILSVTALPLLAGQPEAFTAHLAPGMVLFLAIWVSPLVAICFIRSRKVNAALLALLCLTYLVLTFAEAISEL